MIPSLEKSVERNPIKSNWVFINSCGVSPLHQEALKGEIEFSTNHAQLGNLVFRKIPRVRERLHEAAARLLRVAASDISALKNTAEGLNLIAAGYPFKPGDEIISYVHEYPSNHYCWKLQERRGAVLKLLPDRDPTDTSLPERLSRGWSMKDLEKLVTARTRVIAVSHVQFTAGYACDLRGLGAFCRERGIDLVVDVAQSLGCMPVYPEEWGVSAVVSTGWKWLMGPVGAALMYTAPEFRKKIDIVFAGPDHMRQGSDYLNHTWDPLGEGIKFEYSSVTYPSCAGLLGVIDNVFNRYGIEEIWSEVSRLQEIARKEVNQSEFIPVNMPEGHRSGIFSLISRRADPQKVADAAERGGVICTVRGGYLRIAPHFYLTEEEIVRALAVINTAAREC